MLNDSVTVEIYPCQPDSGEKLVNSSYKLAQAAVINSILVFNPLLLILSPKYRSCEGCDQINNHKKLCGKVKVASQ